MRRGVGGGVGAVARRGNERIGVPGSVQPVRPVHRSNRSVETDVHAGVVAWKRERAGEENAVGEHEVATTRQCSAMRRGGPHRRCVVVHTITDGAEILWANCRPIANDCGSNASAGERRRDCSTARHKLAHHRRPHGSESTRDRGFANDFNQQATTTSSVDQRRRHGQTGRFFCIKQTEIEVADDFALTGTSEYVHTRTRSNASQNIPVQTIRSARTTRAAG